jgi:Arc/MetJ family transcription regulator
VPTAVPEDVWIRWSQPLVITRLVSRVQLVAAATLVVLEDSKESRTNQQEPADLTGVSGLASEGDRPAVRAYPSIANLDVLGEAEKRTAMAKTLIDVDDEQRAAAQKVLKTETKKDTVNAALRQVTALAARRRDLQRLIAGGLPDLAVRGHVHTRGRSGRDGVGLHGRRGHGKRRRERQRLPVPDCEFPGFLAAGHGGRWHEPCC